MGPSMAVATLWILFGIVSLATAAKPRHRQVPKTELSHPCSRALSRVVRKRFQAHVTRWLKGVQQNQTLEWPDGCPFSPWVDIFGWHEKNKTRSKTGVGYFEWVCNYSGKIFVNEHYIDLHMEKYYMKTAPENGVCLADYCKVFGFCNVTEPSFLEYLSADPPPCDPKALEALKNTCHSVCDRCAPLDDPAMSGANAVLHRSLCEPLTCQFLAEQHHSNRKWCFVGIFVSIMCIIWMFYCACVPPSESYNAFARSLPSTGNAHIIRTKLMKQE